MGTPYVIISAKGRKKIQRQFMSPNRKGNIWNGNIGRG